MAFVPTEEQSQILGGALVSQCVTACPGSGKTATAVRRLIEIRKRLAAERGYVALLSYSNVAVDTFRQEYDRLRQATPGLSTRVIIETVDSFLTTYVLRPHAGRVMTASRQPFLVHGHEPFLASFKVPVGTGQYPRDLRELRVRFDDNGAEVWTAKGLVGPEISLNKGNVQGVVARLGKVGAYTHELGRYWVLRTLIENERLLAVLRQRFPHFLVDEAQDVGHLHGLLLSLLAEEGCSVSLIGDPNQGIYDFAGADGSVLRGYQTAKGVTPFSLSVNRRSLEPIVVLANNVAGTSSKWIRTPGKRRHGVYYLRYDEDQPDALMTAFAEILRLHNYAEQEAVVIARSNATVDSLTGGSAAEGTGATSGFLRAAVLRDRNGDLARAFEFVAGAIPRLLDNAPDGLRQEVLNGSASGDARTLRRLLWRFLRSPETGLPSSLLPGTSKWHPLLKKRTETLLDVIDSETSYKKSANWTRNLTVRKLEDDPLWQGDLAAGPAAKIRIDTVHKVKGEGFPAVMYVVRTLDLKRLLEGTSSEDGRIGYVAITRAMDLLLIAIPTTTSKINVDALEAKGAKPWT